MIDLFGEWKKIRNIICCGVVARCEVSSCMNRTWWKRYSRLFHYLNFLTALSAPPWFLLFLLFNPTRNTHHCEPWLGLLSFFAFISHLYRCEIPLVDKISLGFIHLDYFYNKHVQRMLMHSFNILQLLLWCLLLTVAHLFFYSALELRGLVRHKQHTATLHFPHFLHLNC